MFEQCTSTRGLMKFIAPVADCVQQYGGPPHGAESVFDSFGNRRHTGVAGGTSNNAGSQIAISANEFKSCGEAQQAFRSDAIGYFLKIRQHRDGREAQRVFNIGGDVNARVKLLLITAASKPARRPTKASGNAALSILTKLERSGGSASTDSCTAPGTLSIATCPSLLSDVALDCAGRSYILFFTV